ncbi:FaeA/PapI family transcriptional regulator [Yersinia hibernica]|uniref:FaeA-like family protein n=2 Tax=Yersinia TaxID=629 RepID=A0ABX5R2D4_9GAMM|nr:FaeA/PapI family transcriptional regulator [Yersinia hibernica]AHM75635.1 faeA-like family protein [Yersinia hibernica]QAX79772.1 faeA-like family protein [Yersinia hibernica]
MKPKDQRKEEVMGILEEQCNFLKEQFIESPPPVINWPKTRELADKAQLDIYTARLVLMKLVDENRVKMSETKVMNSLRWFIAHPTEK